MFKISCLPHWNFKLLFRINRDYKTWRLIKSCLLFSLPPRKSPLEFRYVTLTYFCGRCVTHTYLAVKYFLWLRCAGFGVEVKEMELQDWFTVFMQWMSPSSASIRADMLMARLVNNHSCSKRIEVITGSCIFVREIKSDSRPLKNHAKYKTAAGSECLPP